MYVLILIETSYWVPTSIWCIIDELLLQISSLLRRTYVLRILGPCNRGMSEPVSTCVLYRRLTCNLQERAAAVALRVFFHCSGGSGMVAPLTLG